MPPIPVLPVCSGRPTPLSSQLLPLVCLGRANQRITPLEGAHSVRQIRIIYDALSLTISVGANTAGQKPSMFGQTTQQQTPAGNSFGLFGSQQQQQQQQQQQNPQGQQGNTGAFGNQPAFGQANATQPQQGGCKSSFTVYSSGIIY